MSHQDLLGALRGIDGLVDWLLTPDLGTGRTVLLEVQQGGSMAAAALSEATFDEVVAGSDVPVIVEFWAKWCAPCRVLAPVLDSIVAENGNLALYKVNSDEEPGLVERFAVSSVPTTLVFKDGTLATRMVGARGKRHLLEELGTVLS
jgi:thioredoxin 1